jgi:hypothetical protein
LVRGHGYAKTKRLGGSEVSRANPSKLPDAVQQPRILQKITDFTQYHVFCRHLKEELDKTMKTLSEVGIKTLLRFNPAGEPSHQIIKLLTEDRDKRLGGDASLYIDERYVNPALSKLHLKPKLPIQIFITLHVRVTVNVGCSPDQYNALDIVHSTIMPAASG